MTVSRRDITKLAAASALAAQAAPAAAFFHNRLTPENFPERLTDDLNALLKPGCQGGFSVIRSASRDAPFWSLDAAVKLHWPPGWRSRAFRGAGNDIEEAYADLLAVVRDYFDAVWTMPDGSGCLV